MNLTRRGLLLGAVGVLGSALAGWHRPPHRPPKPRPGGGVYSDTFSDTY